MKNVLLTAAGMLLLAGCTSVQRTPPMEVWDDMKHQGKYTAQASSGFFADGRATRLAPEDTVAHGYLTEETPYNTGMDGALYVGKNPVPMTAALLDQGQTKFNIYCQPCHDKTGSGRGIVPTRVQADGGAPWTPANLNEQRLVEAADGDIFNTITNGRRTMPAYRYQITVADRWAIVAYVRLLQRASHGTANEVPDAQKAELK